MCVSVCGTGVDGLCVFVYVCVWSVCGTDCVCLCVCVWCGPCVVVCVFGQALQMELELVPGGVDAVVAVSGFGRAGSCRQHSSVLTVTVLMTKAEQSRAEQAGAGVGEERRGMRGHLVSSSTPTQELNWFVRRARRYFRHIWL